VVGAMSYDDDACGPDCVGTTCCRSAASAARSYCGCGGGVDHSDCPEVDEDEDEDEDEG
jgi:hypothetical protein